MDMADLIRVKTASDYMRVTSQYIYTLIEKKRLQPTVIDEVTFVSRKAVVILEAERQKEKEEKEAKKKKH